MNTGDGEPWVLPDDLEELERVLRNRLAGRRLVYEAGFDEALRPHLSEALGLAIDALGAKARSDLAKRYPALTVVAIVLDAVFAYDGGELWPNLQVKDRNPPLLGPAFSSAIVRLGIEQFPSFEEQHAQRHVARVLAHGGIPHRSLPRFFQFLDETLRESDADPASCLELIRYSPKYRTAIPQPVRRFLAETGAVGVDLLTRTIELIEETDGTEEVEADSNDRGLPRHIIEGFKAHRRSSPSLGIASRLGLRTLVRFEGEYGEGPFLVLPPIPQRVPDSCIWQLTFEGVVEDGTAPRIRRTARRDVATEVEVPPAALWRVELWGHTGETLYSRSIPCLRDRDVLVFAADDGELVRDARFSPGLVHVLSRCELHAEGPGVQIIRKLPRSESLAWSEWFSYEVAISGLSMLVGRFLGEEVRLSLGLQVQLPLVLEDGIAGVTSEDGLAVYAHMPALVSLPWTANSNVAVWAVQARINGTLHTIAGRTRESIQSELDRLVRSDRISEVRLTFRASLGESTAARFLVVPGFACDVTRRLITPEDPPVRCGLRVAPGLTVTDGQGTTLNHLSIGGIESDLSFVVMDGEGSRNVLRLMPNLLRWRVVRDKEQNAPLGTKPVFLGVHDAKELERMHLQLIAAETEAVLELELRRADRILMRVPLQATRRLHGGWRAELRAVREAMERETGTTFDLCLRVRNQLMIVAVIQEITAITLETGAFVTECNRVYFIGTLACAKTLTGRRILLKCIDRPWRPDFEVPIDDDPADSCRIDLTGRVGRGRYVLTPGVGDGLGDVMWYHETGALVCDLLDLPEAASDASIDTRDHVLDAIKDGRTPVIPADAHQRAAEAIGMVLCGETLAPGAEMLIEPLLVRLDADWHRVLSELHSTLNATAAALLRVCVRLMRLSPQALIASEYPVSPTIAPAAALFWIGAQDRSVRRELARTFLDELGVRGVLKPSDIIGGEPMRPSPAQLADYRALCRATIALLSANGRARAVFSPLLLPNGVTLIPEWTARYAALLEVPDLAVTPASFRALARELSGGLHEIMRTSSLRLRPFHLVTMAAAYHLWIRSASARSAEQCLLELTKHLTNYCACRLAGIGALALMGDT
jgi:hypothetical protein